MIARDVRVGQVFRSTLKGEYRGIYLVTTICLGLGYLEWSSVWLDHVATQWVGSKFNGGIPERSPWIDVLVSG